MCHTLPASKDQRLCFAWNPKKRFVACSSIRLRVGVYPGGAADITDDKRRFPCSVTQLCGDCKAVSERGWVGRAGYRFLLPWNQSNQKGWRKLSPPANSNVLGNRRLKTPFASVSAINQKTFKKVSQTRYGCLARKLAFTQPIGSSCCLPASFDWPLQTDGFADRRMTRLGWC